MEIIALEKELKKKMKTKLNNIWLFNLMADL
jgi:hypothetical protein